MKKFLIGVPAALLLATGALAQENGLNETHLRALDADGDASISMEEFGAFSDFAFEQMDTDKNGSLSKSEVDAHADDGAFGRADADGNGTVTQDEFKSRMEENFKQADKDGDGQLN